MSFFHTFLPRLYPSLIVRSSTLELKKKFPANRIGVRVAKLAITIGITTSPLLVERAIADHTLLIGHAAGTNSYIGGGSFNDYIFVQWRQIFVDDFGQATGVTPYVELNYIAFDPMRTMSATEKNDHILSWLISTSSSGFQLYSHPDLIAVSSSEIPELSVHLIDTVTTLSGESFYRYKVNSTLFSNWLLEIDRWAEGQKEIKEKLDLAVANRQRIEDFLTTYKRNRIPKFKNAFKSIKHPKNRGKSAWVTKRDYKKIKSIEFLLQVREIYNTTRSGYGLVHTTATGVYDPIKITKGVAKLASIPASWTSLAVWYSKINFYRRKKFKPDGRLKKEKSSYERSRKLVEVSAINSEARVVEYKQAEIDLEQMFHDSRDDLENRINNDFRLTESEKLWLSGKVSVLQWSTINLP